MMRVMYAALSLLLACSGASAGVIISDSTVDTRFGAAGRAALQGLEWLALSETAGLSRDAVVDNDGIAFIADGWRYATRGETETLITSLWGGTYDGWSAENYDGARWFISTFGSLFDSPTGSFYTGFTTSRFLFGDIDECDPGGFPGRSCVGLIQAAEDANGDIRSLNVLSGLQEVAYAGNLNTLEGLGWIREDWGADLGLSVENNSFATRLALDDTASLLVRDVPAPATIVLMGIGLLGLRFRHTT